MEIAIVVAPVFGKFPVVEVWYVKAGKLLGWRGLGRGAPRSMQPESHWKTPEDVVRSRSHEVVNAGLVEVADEDAAIALLGRELRPP